MKELDYYVVLYKNDELLPIHFESREDADDYIFEHQLKAYIIIK